jgi:cyclophilin family peptidyl-prolyl cis-trans isomerase
VLAQLAESNPNDVRIVYRHFPLLSIHDKAALATQASEAAGLQDKFWEMHDLLYATQSEWSGMSVEEFQTWLVKQAGELGLDQAQFEKDLVSATIAAIPQEAWEAGQVAELPGTPYTLINGKPYNGPRDPWTMEAILKMFSLEDKQFTQCPPMTVDPTKQYIATIKTEKGDIVIELLPQVAPMAVNSFIFLANNGWFDGVTFHRVLPGFVAQSGDPTGTGYGGPGYAFDNEISPDYKYDKEGVVGMANAGPGSNGSQFFITYDAISSLDGGYTIFGQVISGMDVAKRLTSRDPQQNPDLPPGDKIISVTIEEK